MSIWNWIEYGVLNSNRETLRNTIAAKWGYHLAVRHKNVTADKSALISPDAKINPRSGKISIGKNCVIATGACIQGSVKIGNNSSVQTNTIIVGGNGACGMINIGNDVRIAPNVMLIAANHNFDRCDIPIRMQGVTNKPIVIEDNCWIGGRVNIICGVTIGSGSVIGAGSVVTHDIPQNSVAVGAPAKVIKKR